MRSSFVHKKTINFHTYQVNRLEEQADNQYVIIIESPWSSIEELG